MNQVEQVEEQKMFEDMEAHAFVQAFNAMASKAWQNAEDKGFHESKRSFAEEIALMHSELSEALESNRHGSPPSDHIPEFSGEEEELCDVIVRIMDCCISRGYRIPQALVAKMQYNSTRPYKHGKKF